jgi:hypothetical protein
VQAAALDIEAQAKRRLADEYDAAQARGEIARSGDTLRKGPGVPKENSGKLTASDVGLSSQEIHEARRIRDAEKRDPGVVRRTVDGTTLVSTIARPALVSARTDAAHAPKGPVHTIASRSHRRSIRRTKRGCRRT